jgi:hypothetical protein
VYLTASTNGREETPMTVEEKVVKTAPYYKMLQEEGREKGREKKPERIRRWRAELPLI